MVATNLRVVQGLCVKTATLLSKKKQVKLILEAEKDDISAGAGTVADVLVSLEFHSTGADSAPVSVTLQGSPFEFTVDQFKVSQDKLMVALLTDEDAPESDENVNALILSATAYHADNDTPIELTLAAGNNVAGING